MPAFTKILIDGQPVLDADAILDQLSARPEWSKAVNSLTCATGKEPGTGCFLVTKEHFDQVDITGPVDIQWIRDDGEGEADSEVDLTFTGYVVTRAYAAVRVKDSPYLVHVADLRKIYQRSVAMLRFNVRLNVGDAWDTDSLNSGTPYTWQEIVTELRALLPGTTGDNLELPTPPDTTPENLVFEGVSAWDALAMIADLTGHAISYDPFAGEPIFIDLADTPSPDFATQKADLLVLQDLLPAETAHGVAPEKLLVCYRWRVDEECSIAPRKPFTVERTTDIANAVGTEIRWGVLLAEPDPADISADPLNKTDLDDDADVILLSYLSELNHDVAPQSTTVIGLHELQPDAEIQSVTWRVHKRDTRTIVRIGGDHVGLTSRPPMTAGPYFVRIPEDGIDAAEDDGATPSTADCELYTPDESGALVACLDEYSDPILVSVRHYGGAIPARDESTWKYMRIHWAGTGWMIDVAYCQ